MNKTFLISLVAFISAVVARPVMAGGINLDLNVDSFASGDHEPVEGENGGRRDAGITILCSIDSETGVSFGNGATPDILTYEIYDPSASCVGVFFNESDFIDTLFSFHGKYRLVFTTPEFNLSGWVFL